MSESDRFNKNKQDLPPNVQKMLDESPVISPNDGKGYVVGVSPKELHEMEMLKKKWDEIDTEQAMEHIERILDKDRARVFAKAFLERRPIRLSANEDPRKAKIDGLNRAARRRMMKRGKGFG